MKPFVKLFLLSLLLLSVITLFFSYRAMLASFYIYPVNKILDDQSLESLNLSTLEELDDNIDKAMAYVDDADFYEKKARVLVQLAVLQRQQLDASSQPGTEAFQARMVEALDYFRKSLALRPAWARTYVFFAYSKGLMGEFDEEFYQAVAIARRYGEHAYEVQAGLTQLGLQFWPWIRVEEKVHTKAAFVKAYRLAPGRTSAYAPTEALRYMACLWVIEAPSHSAECYRLLELNNRKREGLQQVKSGNTALIQDVPLPEKAESTE